jgi:hypothetical protein
LSGKRVVSIGSYLTRTFVVPTWFHAAPVV